MWKRCKMALAVILTVCFCTGGMFVQAAEPSGEVPSAEELSVENGLLLDFNMDSIENGSVTNSVDNRAFAVQGNSPVLVEGKDDLGKALQFDGGTNYINLGTDYQVASGKVTIAAWVKVDLNPNGLSRIICRSRTPVMGEKDLSLYIRNNGALEAQISSSSWTAADAGTVSLGQWQHVAVTNDGTTQILYLNGAPVKAETISEGPADQWDVPLLIGGGWNTQATAPFTGHMFKGAIDDLKVYDRSLSGEEIQGLAKINRAEIETPKSYQIIQREEDGTAAIPVNGKMLGNQAADVEITLLDSAGEKIEGMEPVQAEVDQETFHAVIQKVPTGLYRIQVTGKSDGTTIFQSTLAPVGIGDLWIIAGQSNAAGYGLYLPEEDVNSAGDDPSMEGVHLYRWASGSWSLASQPIGEVQSPANHAPGLAFAKEISRMENVPVGIMQVAVGGSSISEWLKGGTYYDRILDCFDPENRKAKGMFWYQGEAETLSTSDGSVPQENVDAYAGRFTQLIEDLRSDLHNPSLTVITAQLNSHADRDHRHPPASLWYQMKEIQRQLGDPQSEIYIPNTAVISTSGLKLSDGIHNSANSNVILAKRMAKAALALAYGDEIPWEQPNLSYGVIKDRTILLTFRYADDGLKANGAITDFTVRDDNGTVPIINAQIDGCHVRLKVGRELSGVVKIDGLAAVKPSPSVWNQRNEPMLAFYDVPAQMVNAARLNQLVSKTDRLEKDSYTAGSWSRLQAALLDAKSALNNEYSGQTVLDKAEGMLSEAADGLVVIKSLRDLYFANQDKSNDNYTVASWESFLTALKKAKEVLENAEATQGQVDTAYGDLTSAADGLKVIRVEKNRLLQLYQANKDKSNDNYTAASWESFQSALKKAKEVLENPKAVQGQVDTAFSDLQTSINNLKTRESGGTISKEQNSGDNLQAPLTGDESHFLFPILMLIFAGVIITYIWKKKRVHS